MAQKQIELLKAGPFEGLDLTTASPFVKPGMAASSSNVNTSRVDGALMCEKGRIQLSDFTNVLASITFVMPITSVSAAPPSYLVGGYTAGNASFLTYLYTSGGSQVLIPGAVFFDQAVQFGDVVYTNGGQRFFASLQSIDPNFKWFLWQYPAPQNSAPNISLTTATTGGSIAPGTYDYVITRTTTMPDGTISETSVDLNAYAAPNSIVIPNGTSTNKITVHNSLPWSGTNADGTSYTTNLYRQSSNQPTYTLVANISGSADYVDTASDASIVSAVQLQPYRDQPPVMPGAYGAAAQQYNYAAVVIHKGRVWCFAVVANSSTNNFPQVQLWYSNLGRPWEFNQAQQVLLLNSDVVPSIGSVPVTYQDLYGNDPLALAPVGSILCAFTKRETWGVYGDDQLSFVARRLFKIGSVSRHAVTEGAGGVFWLSENGAYFFDGGAPQYDSEGIRGALRSIGTTGITPSQQLQATACFSNMTWYLSFPTLQQTYSYFTVTGKWLSVLPYAPPTASALMYVPAHPSSYNGSDLNEVVAARGQTGKAIIDWWFADPNFDLGLAQTCTWTSPVTDSGSAGLQKIYRYVTLLAPVQSGMATVTVTVDSQPSVSMTFDLSGASTGTVLNDHAPQHISSLGGDGGGALMGYTASISVTLQGVSGQDAPQIWKLSVWGEIARELVPPT